MKKRFFFMICCLFAFAINSSAQSNRSITDIVNIIKHKSQYPNYYLVAAHRGYWSDAPENSLGAYKKAISLGADIVEMDIRVTKDEVMIVLHDACLDRVTTGYGRAKDENWIDIQRLFLKEHQGTVTQYKVLSLNEALDSLKGKAVVSLDIKETGQLFKNVMIRALKMVKNKGMLGQTIIKGKMPYSELETVCSSAGVSLDQFIYTPIAFSNTANLDTYIRSFVQSGKIYAFELVYKQSADAILSYVSLLNQNSIWVGQYSFWPESEDGVIAEPIPLVDTDPITRPYDFHDIDPTNYLDDGRGDWDWLLSKGANYIITDRSELLIDYLTIKGKRSTNQ